MIVAALYVAPGGCYYGLEGVEPWGLPDRDARLYAGPWPVVAHPPCERWGTYWHGGPNSVRFPRARRIKGDDAGCFAAALAAVRRWGGILEHPASSHAWLAHDLLAPPYCGGWYVADAFSHNNDQCFAGNFGYSCRVEQGNYGHRARKGTWLYACGVDIHPLIWGPSDATGKLDDGFQSAAERRNATPLELLSKSERLSTPLPFRDLLLSIARTADQTPTSTARGRRAP